MKFPISTRIIRVVFMCNAPEKAYLLSSEVFSTISWDGSQHRNAASQAHEVLGRIPF